MILQEFTRPIGSSGLLLGGVISLVFAGFLLLMPGLGCGLSLLSSISTEKTEGEKQHRLADLLISPLPDRQVVLGYLSAALLTVSPWLIAGVVASLFWSFVSLVYGAAWWWLLAELWAVLLVLCLVLHVGLAGYTEWRRFPIVPVLHILLILLPLGAALAFVIIKTPLAATVAALAATLVLGLATLPLSYKRALVAVRTFRDEVDR